MPKPRTAQEIFDIVSAGLLKQNKRSLLPNGVDCAYRGAGGLKCAIGHLISDAEYQESFENLSLSVNAICKAAGITHVTHSLATDLQDCHDFHPVAKWSKRLRDIAQKYDLEFNNDWVQDEGE